MLPVAVLVLLATRGFWPGFEITSEIALWIMAATLIYGVCLLSDRAMNEVSALKRLMIFTLASGLYVLGVAYLLPLGSLARLLWFPDTMATVIVGALGLALFAALSIVSFTNFFNFMDGSDGLAGSMATVGFAALGFLASSPPSDAPGATSNAIALVCFTLSAINLGFLVWNWPRAKVFMGDTGSTFLGFSAMALGWLGSFEGIWHWSIPFIVFFPFWFDASVTVIRRALRGEKIWLAHREHFYQRAILSFRSDDMSVRHRRLLIPAIVTMLFCAGAGIGQSFGLFGLNWSQGWVSLGALFLVHGAMAMFIERRYQASLLAGAASSSAK
jgi:UDP-N-acetylmuramyl pentapeptide phosphotransferase/UDP-N-acetylglucosamine-1-phosphate transferase